MNTDAQLHQKGKRALLKTLMVEGITLVIIFSGLAYGHFQSLGIALLMMLITPTAFLLWGVVIFALEGEYQGRPKLYWFMAYSVNLVAFVILAAKFWVH